MPETYVKNYSLLNKKPERFGGGNEFLFETELEAYRRLKGQPHFPELIDYNREEHSLTLEHVGISLMRITVSRMAVPMSDYIKQTETIINTLIDKKIFHMDMSDRNICYKDSQIFLIDFEGCVFDSTPANSELDKQYKALQKKGGYDFLLRMMQGHVERHLLHRVA